MKILSHMLYTIELKHFSRVALHITLDRNEVVLNMSCENPDGNVYWYVVQELELHFSVPKVKIEIFAQAIVQIPVQTITNRTKVWM